MIEEYKVTSSISSNRRKKMDYSLQQNLSERIQEKKYQVIISLIIHRCYNYNYFSN